MNAPLRYVIVYCSAAAVPMYRLHKLPYVNATYCSKVENEFNFAAVPHCSSRRRDGISGTATATQLAAVYYERSFNWPNLKCSLQLSKVYLQHYILIEVTSWYWLQYRGKIITWSCGILIVHRYLHWPKLRLAYGLMHCYFFNIHDSGKCMNAYACDVHFMIYYKFICLSACFFLSTSIFHVLPTVHLIIFGCT